MAAQGEVMNGILSFLNVISKISVKISWMSIVSYI